MIESILRDMGFELTSTLVRDDFDGRKGQHTFAVTLVRNGESLHSDYSAGCAHRHYRDGKPIVLHYGRLTYAEVARNQRTKPDVPTLTDVMSCFVLDAQCVADGQTLVDFIDELGYNDDLRAGERAYNACRDTYFGLKRLARPLMLEGVNRLFEDY